MSRRETEDTRRRQLIETTIDTMAEVGFVATTLGQIARRAGVSAGLVAHYFGDKDGLLEATMRALGARVSRGAAARLAEAATPRARVQAIIDANLAPEEFDQRTGTVWLAFWGQTLHSQRFKRVQAAYQRRIITNLRHALRQAGPPGEAQRLAVSIAAIIDGLWLRATLSGWSETDAVAAGRIASEFVDGEFTRLGPQRAGSGAMAPSTGQAGVRRLGAHIGGRAVRVENARTFETRNPATGEVLAEIEIAGAAEVDRAVAAARAGQRVWAAMTGSARGRILNR
ncbi:MAG TPA: transcriptional regulator BetI, partial [Acetobacteraceae bacterium]|nr:transcriptional regulator BetI [Acetobacteraceae bacterium]